jgi:hypothetical protein
VPAGGGFDFLAAVLQNLTGNTGTASDHVDDDHQPLLRRGGGCVERGTAGEAAAGTLPRTDRVRADTAVVEADVGYPTDSGLLAKAVGTMCRSVVRIKAAGGATRTRVRDRRHSAGRRARSIASQLRLRGQQQRDQAQDWASPSSSGTKPRSSTTSTASSSTTASRMETHRTQYIQLGPAIERITRRTGCPPHQPPDDPAGHSPTKSRSPAK